MDKIKINVFIEELEKIPVEVMTRSGRGQDGKPDFRQALDIYHTLVMQLVEQLRKEYRYGHTV